MWEHKQENVPHFLASPTGTQPYVGIPLIGIGKDLTGLFGTCTNDGTKLLLDQCLILNRARPIESKGPIKNETGHPSNRLLFTLPRYIVIL